MTNRVKGLMVGLEKDMREDDVEGIVNAILRLRNVRSVSPSVVDSSDHLNRSRIKTELMDAIWKVLE